MESFPTLIQAKFDAKSFLNCSKMVRQHVKLFRKEQNNRKRDYEENDGQNVYEE